MLDNDGIVSALSAIDGGQIDEILRRSEEEKAGGMSGGLDAKVVKGKANRGKTKRVEEEMRLARTRSATAAKLLEALHEELAIGIVDGPLDLSVQEKLETGMVIQFRADLQLHPLHQTDHMLQSFIEIAPDLGQGAVVKELKATKKTFGAITGIGRTGSKVLFSLVTSSPQLPRLLLPVPRDHLQVETDDLLGELTVVAQVEKLVPEGESHHAMRVLQGGPATSLEADTIQESLPAMLPALNEMGIEISMDDVVVQGPAVILRAICCYR